MKSLSDYVILKKLGSGSFGDVYLAKHRYINNKVALKVLPEELSQNEKFIENFEKDVGRLTTLDHPSIVKLHNISKADGHYFLVLDAMVDSNDEVLSLERYLKYKGDVLAEVDVETILRQIASALDYAHKINFDNEFLAHRSLKLSNIFVQSTDSGLKVFVSDFGLARLIGEGKVLFQAEKLLANEMMSNEELVKNKKPNVDFTYKFLENYTFLAPEQKFKDLNEKITFRSDIYSFGVLAYYLIAREFPEGYFDLPSKIAPEYKLNWDLLICKCLQKDVNRRPEKLIEALNSFLSTEQSDISSLEILSWEEVERKVENAMQMSFEFSSDLNKDIAKDKPKLDKKSVKFTSVEKTDQKPSIKPQKVDRL